MEQSCVHNIRVWETMKYYNVIFKASFLDKSFGEEATNYKFGSFILNPELYYERYPTLPEMFAYEKNTDPELAKYNKLKNNLAINSVAATTGTNTLKYGDVSGNVELTECNDFVNPAVQDYRIKSDYLF